MPPITEKETIFLRRYLLLTLSYECHDENDYKYLHLAIVNENTLISSLLKFTNVSKYGRDKSKRRLEHSVRIEPIKLLVYKTYATPPEVYMFGLVVF